MMAQEQFEKAKQFIFRQGRLIDRKRFLYFHYFGWYSDDIPRDLLRSEAENAIGTLQEDGGVRVAQYEQVASYPVWRAIWTLDMLVALKRYGLLNERRAT